MRRIRDIYGRIMLLDSAARPELAIPWIHQEEKGKGPWKLWGWDLVYRRARLHVDHATAKELINDGSDLDEFIRELLAELNAPPEGAVVVKAFN